MKSKARWAWVQPSLSEYQGKNLAVLGAWVGKAQGGTIPKGKDRGLSEKIKNSCDKFLRKTSNPPIKNYLT
ncbi:MAG: hypothetical protein RR233_07985 [Clostridiales bacterium]